MKKQTVFVLAITLMALAASPAPAEVLYNVTDLGTLGGGSSTAWSINNNGQIAGYAQTISGSGHAALFDATGKGSNIDLGTLGGGYSYAYSINNSGQIVGCATTTPEKGIRATLFDPTGKGNNIDLGALDGYLSSALSINNNGQIVGYATVFIPQHQADYSHAVLFDATGEGNNIDLGTLGGYYSSASSINDSGQIVGTAITAPMPPRKQLATLFDPTGGGNNIDLGTLDGYLSSAISINNNGRIVGYAEAFVPPETFTHYAVLFDAAGEGNNIDLGTLGGVSGIAQSINNSGQIVGYAETISGSKHATLFDPTGNGNNIDLNTLIDPNLGWMLERAYSINDSGRIVGSGINPAGELHAYLLTPEPAPVPSVHAGYIVSWDDRTDPCDGNDFVAIAAGWYHNLALKQDGSLVGWGYNTYGQATPPDGNDFVAIDAGYFHSLALKQDGSIIGWGAGGPGQSGHPHYGQATPPDGNDFVAISAGLVYSLALKQDGSIVHWGRNNYGEAAVPDGNDFVAISAGWQHCLALKQDGSIVAWGNNFYGECNIPSPNTGFVAVAAGGWHNLGLKQDGSIVAWGRNDYGQATPPDGNDFVAIAAGGIHSLALKKDGSIVGWGQLPGQSTPPAGRNFVAITAGAYHSLAIAEGDIKINQPPTADAGSDQTVYAWIDGFADVTFDGSDSNDADGDELTYKWTWTIGSQTYEANGVSPTIELPIGVHAIQLMVNDGLVDSAPDDVNVTVVAPLKGKLQVMPCVINRRSNQPSIHACIELPYGFYGSAVDANEPFILYPGEIEATRQWILPVSTGGQSFEGISLFFDKAELMNNILTDGLIEVSVEGKFKSGQYFYGTDIIRINH